VPAIALRAALGGFADEGALVSQRAVPRRLLAAGFSFTYTDLNAALRAML
jgi:NAD dependent epimerase/dehydratase family enzyme